MVSHKLLTIQDVSREIGMHPMTVYRFAQRGLLPGFKVGGRWRFERKLLNSWLMDQVQISRLQADAKRETNEK
ncbi:MAG: helix-turn-helix domain-containing protein [Candidatus Omnitrophica bacterium]|nr:helix-turn-helix domain-containing protein [Candidatus Omnitrophota bacterium]